MMKKIYISPEMMVVTIEPRTMLAESIVTVSGAEGLSRGSGDFEGGVADVKASNPDAWDSEW